MNPTCLTSPCQACCLLFARVIRFFIISKPELRGLLGAQTSPRGWHSSPAQPCWGPMAGPRGPSGAGKRRRWERSGGCSCSSFARPAQRARAGLSPGDPFPAPSPCPGRVLPGMLPHRRRSPTRWVLPRQDGLYPSSRVGSDPRVMHSPLGRAASHQAGGNKPHVKVCRVMAPIAVQDAGQPHGIFPSAPPRSRQEVSRSHPKGEMSIASTPFFPGCQISCLLTEPELLRTRNAIPPWA